MEAEEEVLGQKSRRKFWIAGIAVGVLLLLSGLVFLMPKRKGETLDLGPIIAEAKLANQLQTIHKAWLEKNDSLLQTTLSDVLYAPRQLKAFYQSETGRLLWVNPQGLNAQGQAMVQRIQDAGLVGLMPRDYHAEQLMPVLDSLKTDKSGSNYLKAEYLLTDAFMMYYAHLRYGKMDSTIWYPYWGLVRKDSSIDYSQLLVQAHQKGIEPFMTALQPKHKHFGQLQASMRTYRDLKDSIGDWPRVPYVLKLERGQEHSSVPYLRKRLRDEAYLPADIDTTSTHYTPDVAAAVQDFQKYHGLNADGVIAKNTLEALNVSLPARVEQLRLNLARWRWAPQEWGDQYLWVNVPEFKLLVYKGDSLQMSMRAIVGKTKRRTPFISSTISHLIFNPYWTVPDKLIEEDILPLAMKNPNYLNRMNIKLLDEEGNAVQLDSTAWDSINVKKFPYRVRQDPGWGNSLGRVMFMFPNGWSVYLHDTPDKSLFGIENRALSSGCIRLQQPMKLADYLMQEDEKWDKKKREEILDDRDEESGKLIRKAVEVPERYQVHLYYFTARADAGGTYFFHDVYKRDEKRLKILRQRHRFYWSTKGYL